MGEVIFSIFVGLCLVFTGGILNKSLSSEDIKNEERDQR